MQTTKYNVQDQQTALPIETIKLWKCKTKHSSHKTIGNLKEHSWLWSSTYLLVRAVSPGVLVVAAYIAYYIIDVSHISDTDLSPIAVRSAVKSVYCECVCVCVCVCVCGTALQRACDNKDAKAIRREVERIRQAGLTKYLQNETREAMYLVELLERMPANKNVLDMGRKLMTEIRRYQNPPPAMHRIMQSALLLLGEDEDTTDVRISRQTFNWD